MDFNMEYIPKINISIKDAINEYFNEKEAISALSPVTIKNRKWELKRFQKFCKGQNIEFAVDIQRNTVISYLKELNVSKSSKSGIMYTLSSFFDYMVTQDYVLDNYANTIEKPKYYTPRTDYLSFEELQVLFQDEAQNGNNKFIDRNLLLFSLFTDTCLRVSEVVNLRMEDVRLDLKEVWVTRKRQKVENVPISDFIVQKFENWLSIRPYFKGSNLPWIFLSSHGKQLKPRQIHNIISKALLRANIHKRKQGPHLLRHSGASLKAKSGENLIMIQYLLGHENLNTTRRYLHFDWEDLKRMVNRSPSFETGGPPSRNEHRGPDSKHDP